MQGVVNGPVACRSCKRSGLALGACLAQGRFTFIGNWTMRGTRYAAFSDHF